MRHAFTLIELLVVMAIIAILTAILLPVIGLVRDAAQTTRCLSNNRQIGVAVFAYAADFNNRVMPAKMDYSGVANQPIHWMGLVALYDANSTQEADKWGGWGAGVLSAAVIRDCPVWRSRVPAEVRASLPWRTGYGMNAQPAKGLPGVVGDQHNNWFHFNGSWDWGQPHAFRLAAIDQPTQRVLVGDAQDWWIGGNESAADNFTDDIPASANYGFQLLDPSDPAYQAGFRFGNGDPVRHRGRTAYVFFDGRASTVPASRALFPLYRPAKYMN